MSSSREYIRKPRNEQLINLYYRRAYEVNEMMSKSEGSCAITESLTKQMEYTRLQNGLTNDEFCKLIGVKSNTYMRYKNGARSTPLEVFIRYCFIFGCDVTSVVSKTLTDTNEERSDSSEIGSIVKALPETVLKQILYLIESSDDMPAGYDTITIAAFKALIKNSKKKK